jgi:hypothetical protein
MREPARRYGEILRTARLETLVPERPQVFVSPEDSWTELVIRYLVGARERRAWKSRLALAVAEELRREEHRGRILEGYPRRQVELLEPAEGAGPGGGGRLPAGGQG